MLKLEELQVVILAGGKGTRLKKISGNVPKPIMTVNNKPFVNYLLDKLDSLGFRNVFISLCYNPQYFIKVLGCKYRNLKISYILEKEALDTGGAIINSIRHSKKKYLLVMNGDSYPDMDFKKFLNDYNKKYDVFIALNKTTFNAKRFGSVSIDENYRVLEFNEKSESKTNYINSGIYIFRRNILRKLTLQKISLERKLFKNFIKTTNFYSWPFVKKILDIGTPASFYKASDYLRGVKK